MQDVVEQLDRGVIVWVELGPRGDWKKRPAVVVTNYMELATTGKLYVIVGSHQSRNAEIEVQLPHRARVGHPLTKLKAATHIVCDWVERISVKDVLEVGGTVPPTSLASILAKTNALLRRKRK